MERADDIRAVVDMPSFVPAAVDPTQSPSSSSASSGTLEDDVEGAPDDTTADDVTNDMQQQQQQQVTAAEATAPATVDRRRCKPTPPVTAEILPSVYKAPSNEVIIPPNIKVDCIPFKSKTAVKNAIALNKKPITELRSVTRRIGSQFYLPPDTGERAPP